MARMYYGQALIEASVGAAFERAVREARDIGEWLNPGNQQNRRQLTNTALGGDPANIRTALRRYFGVNFPLNAADGAFVERLSTVYRAMATALNSWAVHVAYADRTEHDVDEYASARPPVVFPNGVGEPDPANPQSFRTSWADVRANIDRGTQTYQLTHNGAPITVRPASGIELAFKITLNSRFRNVDDYMKCETVIHEMSHVLADTNDDEYADDVAAARQICANQGTATARDTADCWGFFALDWH